jgi:hypothetical protein
MLSAPTRSLGDPAAFPGLAARRSAERQAKAEDRRSLIVVLLFCAEGALISAILLMLGWPGIPAGPW